jgi:hypothetical protein
MNRRNFILGLGTAATLSGAASVTGAALQDTVEPTADFRVISSENLEVSRNSNLTQSTNENFTNADPFEYNATAGQPGPNMSVDGGTNDGLGMQLAVKNEVRTNNSNSSVLTGSGDQPYVDSDAINVPDGQGGEAPLEVFNDTAEAQEIGVNFATFGADADGDTGDVRQDLVLDLFEFYVVEDAGPAANGESGTDGQWVRISPDDTDENNNLSAGNGAVINSGATKEVHLKLNMNSTIQSAIQNAASADGVGGFNEGATDDVNLLETVEFGVIN